MQSCQRLLSHRVWWAALVAGGGVWGLGAARALAYGCGCRFCFSAPGAIALAMVGALGAGALGALGAGLVLKRAGRDMEESLPGLLVLWLPLIDILSGGAAPWRGPVLLVGSLTISVLVFVRPPRWIWIALAVLAPLAVYLPDISPYVGRADTFEFQVIGPQLGIAHPSGYPLYTLICKAFSLLPVGTVAWRVNLTSAVFAAAASGVMALVMPKRWPHLGLLTGWLLAFSPTLWSRAIEAEVYALNALIVVTVLWLVTAWTDGRLGAGRAWPALGLMMGLALASHVTLGALGAVALGGLAAAEDKPKRNRWLLAVGLGALGMLLYAYIPLRWPAVTGGERMSLVEFLQYVTNAGSGGALRPLAFVRDPGRWRVVGRLILEQVGWVGLALAGVGWGSLVRQRRWVALGTLVSFGAWVWFNLSFYVAEPDYSAFLIPAFVVLVFWMGWGVQEVASAFQRLRATRIAGLGLATGGAWVVLVAGLVFGRVWHTGPTLNTTALGRSDELWARYVLSLPLADGAAILADSEKFPPLYYLQQVYSVRPDLELVTLFSESQYRQALDRRLETGQPVYLARYLPGVDGYGVSSMGPLVEVAPKALLRRQIAEGVRFGDGMVLETSQLDADAYGRAMHHLLLTWRVEEAIEDDLELHLRLVDPGNGREILNLSEGRPVGGYTTTRAWQVGWTVDDYHALSWPEWVPGGEYRLELALTPRFEQAGLPVGGSEGHWYTLGQVTLPGARPVLEVDGIAGQAPAVLLGRGLWLIAAQFPYEAAAGAPVDLDLTWVCTSQNGSGQMNDTLVDLLWIREGEAGATDTLAGTTRLVANGENGVTVRCDTSAGARERVVRRYSVDAPEEPGQYRLEVGAPSGQARCRWLGTSQAACPIGTVAVTPATAGEAVFDGQIVLVTSSFDASGVAAGGPLHVALTWRGVQALGSDYTVFVQAIGPDGKLYGQVDSWPVQGTRPTSGWIAGEEVLDAHVFYITPERPSGEYRVIVGWYLLADMTRLPVVDNEGNAIGDSVELGTFSLP